MRRLLKLKQPEDSKSQKNKKTPHETGNGAGSETGDGTGSEAGIEASSEIGNEIWLEAARDLAKSLMPADDLHGIGHVRRVVHNIKLIQKQGKANPFVLEMAAWLHDIGRHPTAKGLLDKSFESSTNPEIKRTKNHALVSAEIAENFLKKIKLPISSKIDIKLPDLPEFPQFLIEPVLSCIREHSFSANLIPSSLESKILSDADKLDALGAIGVFRTAAYQHEVESGLAGMIRHFHDKLLKLSAQMQTKTGRDLASQRTDFLRIYLSTLLDELGNDGSEKNKK